MPCYRILQNISIGYDQMIRRNAIEYLSLGETKLRVLEERGAISRLSTPPLSILPDWKDRAVQLDKTLDVKTVEDLLDALHEHPNDIASLFELPVEDVLHWKEDLIRDYLTV